MDRNNSDRPGGKAPPATRDARLKAALRANLQRRKLQGRARAADEGGTPEAEPGPDED